MPDWSYGTLLQPLFRRLPDELGRRFVNAWFAGLCRLPGGYAVVDLLGAMLPATEHQTDLPGAGTLPSNLLMGNCIDPRGRAARAYGRFGFGALVVGPVARDVSDELEFRRLPSGGIEAAAGPMLSLAEAQQRGWNAKPAKIFFELDPFGEAETSDTLRRMLADLGDAAAGFILSPQCWSRFRQLDSEAESAIVEELIAGSARANAQAFVGIPCDADADELREFCARWTHEELGFYIAGSRHGDRWHWDRPEHGERALQQMAIVREGGDAWVAVAAGSASPRQALELEQAGANLVVLGAGMVEAGPGLARRVNEARSYFGTCRDRRVSTAASDERDNSWERQAWSWGVALGVALLVGALLAGWSALTHVLLPYDEAFLGKTAAELERFNPRILKFMTHDRITLAGTMVSLGILYMMLSWSAMRQGERWAQVIVALSSAIGFFTFFAFLGFGYLDPFHAFVTLALAQVTTQVVVRPLPKRLRIATCPRLDNDRGWYAKLWGQLLFLAHGVALLLAGTTILVFGMSVVFVPQDINYLGMSADQIAAFDAQLRALIAHDRATFGGMLLCAGTALCLTSMWSFRQGQRWLFWTLVVIIFTPYVMTLWIHFSIGYHDHFHLAPVYIGLGLLAAAALLSAPVMLARGKPRLDLFASHD